VTKLDFTAFQATRQFHPDARDCGIPEIVEFLETHEHPVPVLIYDGSYVIELSTPWWPPELDEQYMLTIGNGSWSSDDLAELEKVLWDWYLTA
jgi:hypothetical protein